MCSLGNLNLFSPEYLLIEPNIPCAEELLVGVR